jgi:hypothetical protein
MQKAIPKPQRGGKWGFPVPPLRAFNILGAISYRINGELLSAVSPRLRKIQKEDAWNVLSFSSL